MSTVPHQKTLSATDVTLYTVSAVLLVDQLAMSAAVGEAALFWWLVVIVLFLIPNTLVTAELGTTYPEQGGIYSWVRDAFGTRWGARVSWLYWVNIALWMPASYVMFTGIFTELFMPGLALWWQIALGVALCWLTAWANCINLKYSKWIPNLGTPLKFLIIFTLGAAGLNYGWQHGFANDLSLSNAFSQLEQGLNYVPVIVYGCLGIELISASSDEIRDPQKVITRAMLAAALISAALYIFGTAGILAAVPAEQVEMVDILATTLKMLFGGSPLGDNLALLFGALALFTIFATMVTWTLGGNRAMAEAAEEGEMPAIFGRLHKTHQAPIGAALMSSLVGSVIMVLYGFMAHSAGELFWNLFTFSAIIFLLPYMGMHLAFLKLRQREPPPHCPFRIPGGKPMALFLPILCLSILVLSVLLFFWTPGQPLDWLQVSQIVGGVIITLVLGEFLVQRAELSRQATATRPTD